MTIKEDAQESSTVHRGSKGFKDTVYPKHVKESRKQDDNVKGRYSSGWPHSRLPCETNQSFTVGNHHQEISKATSPKDDELVKYMSKLPRYLQRLDPGDSIQGKAFNVGVLDWSRLERWNGKQSCTHELDDQNLSFHRRQHSTSSLPRRTEGRKLCTQFLHMHPEVHSINFSDREFPSVLGKSSKTFVETLPKVMKSEGLRHNRRGSMSGDMQKNTKKILCDIGTITVAEKTEKFEYNVGISETSSCNDNYVSSFKETGEEFPIFINQPLDTNMMFQKDRCSLNDIPRIESSSQDVKCESRISSSQSLGELRKSNASTSDYTDFVSRRGRDPSPRRHFGFSVSKMTRSCSFKESSTIAQHCNDFVSVRSGPLPSEGSLSTEDCSVKNSNSRSRASPLRRMLDPLRKLKSSASFDSSLLDSNRASKKDLFSSKSANEERGTPFEYAHLQLLMKNKRPLFRFAPNSRTSVLAATQNNAASSSKLDSGYCYTIYSIEEIKKKNTGWMNYGSKEKNRGFFYNIIGQVKVSNSYLSRSSEKLFMNTKECVLFDCEMLEEDKLSQQFMPGRELAAVVIMPSNDIFGDDKCKSVTVIVPGAFHSLPNKGGPSPLIQRWKSGGICDCGGWDVGCKLCIFSNENFILTEGSDSATTEHLDLFLQDEGGSRETVFSLKLVEKGLYVVKYSSSVSSLQAFFVCVSVISANAEDGDDDGDGDGDGAVADEGKYVPVPPCSPVSRV